MPSVFEPPPGCRFHPRCPVAVMPRCAEALPPTAVHGAHSVECIHGLKELAL
jgi:ABC-type dipeptide/oligopeptide/nickel transport system ATPase component